MTPLIHDTITIFLGIIIEAVPFLLLGVVVSNILKFCISEEKIVSFVPKNPVLATIFGTAFGFFFPVCECGNIPVARQLILKKIRPYVAISFLLAAPVFNPIVIFATYVAFPDQPEILILRVVLSIFIAMFVGIVFSFCTRDEEIVRTQVVRQNTESISKIDPETADKNLHNHNHEHHHHQQKSFRDFCVSMVGEFFQMGGVMVLGAFLASSSQAIFSRESIIGIANDPVTAILAMMILAVVISICSNVDAFFALAYAPTFSTASLLAFLVFGPMIDIKAVLMLRTIFTKKAIVYITLLTFFLTFSITLFLNLNVS